MTLEEFVAILSDEYATAEFEYNGKRCGIEPETSDSNTTYAMWYGETWKDYSVDRCVYSHSFILLYIVCSISGSSSYSSSGWITSGLVSLTATSPIPGRSTMI